MEECENTGEKGQTDEEGMRENKGIKIRRDMQGDGAFV